MTKLSAPNLYDLLDERGLVAQTTDENIRQRLNRPVAAYIGFDATADSLHIGSLLPIIVLRHLQDCGHRPVVLIGGATTLVGDPTGRIESRKMLTREQIDHNAACIADQVRRIVRFDDSPTGGVMVNNADWLAEMNWIEMLRAVGPHFSINRMLALESVSSRLEAGGLTFLEFNYMIMQGYDFVHLHREMNCTLQMGAQDQWGNIIAGVELGRRMDGVSLAGLTFPLLLKADGTKFGKSKSGALWLDADRTPPYDLYQYLRNTGDRDVGKLLGHLTFLPMDRVRELAAHEGQALNQAKEVLAYEVTKLVHGEAEAEKARGSARKAFGAAQDVTGDAIPHAALDSARLTESVGLLALMTEAGLAKSNGEARRLIQGGGVRIHDEVVKDAARQVGDGDVRDGYVLIRVGKKRLFRYDVA